MTRSQPDLSVIVVTHGGKDLALATLRSARGVSGRAHVEWFVVDSGSTDGTPDAIEREFPDIEVLRRPNVGFAAANNVALGTARGRYLLLLNPDVEVRTGTFEDLVGALDARPEVGAASVVQRASDGSLLESIRRFPSPVRQLGESLGAARLRPFRRFQEADTRAARYTAETSVDWLVGAFLLVRAQAIDAVGPLDERFFLYSEETDWCYRIHEAGWDVRHLPFMEITHHTAGYPRAELAAQLSYSKLLFAAKHFGALRRGALRAALVGGHAIRAATFALLSRGRPGLRGRFEAERLALRTGLGAYRPTLGSSPEALCAHSSMARRA